MKLELIEFIIPAIIYGIPVLLAVGGLIIGSILEKRHFESIRNREATLGHIAVYPTKDTDSNQVLEGGELVVASVVVSLDYFKRILASLRNIFGGRVRSYESLLDRAKREAILRLKEQASGCDAIINLRMDTATIANVHARNKGIGGVEVIASGTAIRYQKS